MPEVAALSVAVTADTAGLESGLARANQQVQGFGSQLSSVGAAAGTALAGIGVAAVAGFGGAIKTAADFEKQISAIAAVSGEGEAGMERIRQTALQLGKDTSFSASEAAAGMEEIIKAGLSVEQVVGGAGRAVLDLSAASGTAVEESAQIMSNALNTFAADNMAASDAANLLAGAANASATSVHELGYGLASVGNVAATMGGTFSDTTTALALFAQNGLKGSDAGTSLKTMLLNLTPTTKAQIAAFQDLGIVTTNSTAIMREAAARGLDLGGSIEDVGQRLFANVTGWKEGEKVTDKQSKAWAEASQKLGLMSNQFYDANGNMKSMGDISQVLQTAMQGLTKEQQINYLQTMFGTDAIRAAAIMAKAGAEGFGEMAAAMAKQGDVQKIANQRLDNFLGSWEKFTGSVETAAIMIGSAFLPALKQMVDGLTDGVNEGIEIIEKLPDAWRTIGQVMEGAWEPSDAIDPFVNAVGKAALALKAQFGPAIEAVSGFLTTTLLPAIQTVGQFFADHTEIVLGFAAALGSILAMAGVQAVLAGIAAAVGLLLSPLGLVTAAIAVLVAAWIGNWGGMRDIVLTAWAAIQPALMQLVDWLGVQIPLVLDFLTTTAWPAFVTAATAVSTWITTVAVPAFTALVDWLGPKVSEVVTWITTTGWPGFVAAATTVSTWITGVAIPALTELVLWLGTQLQTVVTWITGTGWPALVTAGTAVSTMVTAMIGFFQALYVELDRRQVFTELGTIWQTITGLGNLLWAAIQKIGEILAPVLVLFQQGKQQGDAFAGALTAMTGAALPAVDPIKAIGAGIQFAVDQVAKGLKPLQDFVAAMQALSQIKLPSFSLPGFGGGGGGGSGATQLSYSGGSHAAPYMDLINQVSQESGVPADVIAAIMDTEGSGANSTSPAGAAGLMQVMPFHYRPGENPYDPLTSIRQGARVLSGNYQRSGNWTTAAGDYFGRGGPDAGGMVDSVYEQRFNANRAKYQGGSSPAAMQKVPLGGGSGGSGVDPSQWPGFMQQTNEQLPEYLQSLETIQQAGTSTFTTVGTVGTEQSQALVSASTDSLGNVTRIYTENGVAIGATITDAAGVVVSSFGSMGTGAVAAAGAMTTGVTGQVATMTTAVQENTNLMASGALTSVTSLGTGVLTTVQTMSGTTIATVTDMQGQVTSQYATLANGAQLSMDGLAAGVLVSTTDLGTGVMTTVQDMSGNYITTITDLAGTVTNQYVQLATDTVQAATDQSVGVSEQAAEMATNVLTSVTDLGTGTLTITQDTSGQMIATITDMAGEVTSQYTTMGSDVTGAVEEMAGAVIEQLQSVAEEFTQAPEAIDDFQSALDNIEPPDLGDIIDGLKDVEDAAKDAADAIKDVSQHSGKHAGGDGKKKGADAKAGGGPVSAGMAYMVGDAGRPELFVPWTDGTILPSVPSGGGGGGISITVNVGSLLANRREIEEAVVVGLESARRRGRVA